MTLEDRGLDDHAALTEANRIMRTYSSAPSARTDPRYTSHPPDYFARQFPLFRNRPLYPAVAAALYPISGARSVEYISTACYVLAVLVMFGILLLYAPPWIAGIGAVALAAAPPVHAVAAVGVTDEPALLLWLLTLGGILLYLKRPGTGLLVAIGIAATLLAFTRPAIYLPVGAALGALVAGWRDPAARRAAQRLLVVTVGAAVIFLVGSALLHGPGVEGQLNWIYDWQTQIGATSSSFAGWYGHALASIAGQALTYEIYDTGALLVIVLAAFGAAVARRKPVVPVAIGIACASVVALVVNPVEFVRTVELPLTPVVILLATCALTALATAAPWQRPTAGIPSAPSEPS